MSITSITSLSSPILVYQISRLDLGIPRGSWRFHWFSSTAPPNDVIDAIVSIFVKRIPGEMCFLFNPKKMVYTSQFFIQVAI